MTQPAETRLRLAGGIAALVLGALFALVNVLFLAVAPQLGITGPTDMRMPEKALPILVESPWLAALYLMGIAFGACVLLMTLGVHEVLRSVAPTRAAVAKACGMIAVALLVGADIARFVALGYLAELHVDEPGLAAPAYVSVTAVLDGLNFAVRFALGAWILLVCWSGLTTNSLSKIVCLMGIPFGAVCGAAFLLPPVPPIADIFWFSMLGIGLLRNPNRGKSG